MYMSFQFNTACINFDSLDCLPTTKCGICQTLGQDIDTYVHHYSSQTGSPGALVTKSINNPTCVVVH